MICFETGKETDRQSNGIQHIKLITTVHELSRVSRKARLPLSNQNRIVYEALEKIIV